MKVVIAHNRYVSANPSGENTVVDAEMTLLGEAGVEVLPFIRSSDEIADLPPARKAMLPVSPIYAGPAQRELAALLTRERPDVLHLHNPYPLLSPWVVRTAHAHGVPVVQTVHNFRHVCVAGVYFRDGHPCHDCLGKAVPYPAVLHACYRGSRAQSAVMATSLTVHRGTWRSVDRYLALTPAIADHLRTYGIPERRITVKPNGVVDPGAHDETGAGLLFVGRLSAEKGTGLLLDAWSRHPVGALGELRIAGDGPLRGEVEAAAAARPDVRYLGRLAPGEVPGAMRAAAAVVIPSTWDEVCPMVAIEALANARPLLVSAKGGLPYLVGGVGAAGGGTGGTDPTGGTDRTGGTGGTGGGEPAGWVVEPEPDAFAAALPRVVAEAPRLAATARRRYLDAFSTDVVTGQLLGVYRELAAVPAAARGE